MNELLEHLSIFQNISDEEIEALGCDKNGNVDAEETLLLYLERDFVQEVNKNIISELENLN